VCNLFFETASYFLISHIAAFGMFSFASFKLAILSSEKNMPLYEYACADCGKPFEVLVLSTSKIDQITCPACKSRNITRRISTFASKTSGGSIFSYGGASNSGCSSSGSL
jgi:putative FmdB family regulatory protein